MNKRGQHQKKLMNKIDKFVIFIIGFMVLFTVTDIVLAINGIYLSSTMENCAYTYFLGECGVCGAIKVSKDVQDAIRTRKETLEDREYYENKDKEKK